MSDINEITDNYELIVYHIIRYYDDDNNLLGY